MRHNGCAAAADVLRHADAGAHAQTAVQRQQWRQRAECDGRRHSYAAVAQRAGNGVRQARDACALCALEVRREHIRQRKVQKAMESFGSWKGREGTSVDIVNDLRKEGDRDYAGRSH